jgi:hypothetical protein
VGDGRKGKVWGGLVLCELGEGIKVADVYRVWQSSDEKEHVSSIRTLVIPQPFVEGPGKVID